jgi:hypothetical protein
MEDELKKLQESQDETIKRLNVVEQKYAEIQGIIKTLQTLGASLVLLVLGASSFNSIIGIPDEVAKKVDAEVSKEVPIKVKDQVKNALGPQISGIIVDAQQKVDKALLKFDEGSNELKTTIYQTRSLLHEVKNLRNSLDFKKDTAPKTNYKSNGNPNNTNDSEDKAADSQSPRNEEPVPQYSNPTILFSNSWVKPGYFLPIRANLRLNVVNVNEDEKSCTVELFGETLVIGLNNSIKRTIDSSRYNVTLTRLDSAGFNPFKLACFFSVTEDKLLNSNVSE